MLTPSTPTRTETRRLTPYQPPATHEYTPRLSLAEEVQIGSMCQDMAPRSDDRFQLAWQRLKAAYCQEHAVDGWSPEQARAKLASALVRRRRLPDGSIERVEASKASVSRYWAGLIEAGLIHLEVTGTVRLIPYRVYLPGVLEANGGTEAHADRAARRLALRRTASIRRRESAKRPQAEPASTVSSADGWSLRGGHYSATECLKSPKQHFSVPQMKPRPQQRDTSGAPHTSPPPPVPAGLGLTNPPITHSLNPTPCEPNVRRRTALDPVPGPLPLADHDQANATPVAPRHEPPRKAVPTRIAAPKSQKTAPERPMTSVAAPNPQAPISPAVAPKPAGYGGVGFDGCLKNGQTGKTPAEASTTKDPLNPEMFGDKAFLTAWLAARGLSPIPTKKPTTQPPMTRMSSILDGVVPTPNPQSTETPLFDEAERDMRRPWGCARDTYEALCELKFRKASEATARQALHPMAMAALLEIRSWPEWMAEPGAEVSLGRAHEAFDGYVKAVRARRQDLRLPDGPPVDPVAMVRFLEAATLPAARAYAFDGRSIVGLRLSARQLLKAVEQADEAFQKRKVGPGKAYAAYLHAIAARLASSGSTG